MENTASFMAATQSGTVAGDISSRGFLASVLPFWRMNGVVARLSGMEPSNLPATLTPDQAVVAARLRKARIFCPIQFGQFDHPETYRQYPELERALRDAAIREGVSLRIVKNGETMPLNR